MSTKAYLLEKFQNNRFRTIILFVVFVAITFLFFPKIVSAAEVYINDCEGMRHHLMRRYHSILVYQTIVSFVILCTAVIINRLEKETLWSIFTIFLHLCLSIFLLDFVINILLQMGYLGYSYPQDSFSIYHCWYWNIVIIKSHINYSVIPKLFYMLYIIWVSVLAQRKNIRDFLKTFLITLVPYVIFFLAVNSGILNFMIDNPYSVDGGENNIFQYAVFEILMASILIIINLMDKNPNKKIKIAIVSYLVILIIINIYFVVSLFQLRSNFCSSLLEWFIGISCHEPKI
ncbi:hypothetical protein JW887_00485 [Candidatus Dojkabacteria bacterium]|nr:hypothetical protein [Candidatus Dojkabacteria bacterium]